MTNESFEPFSFNPTEIIVDWVVISGDVTKVLSFLLSECSRVFKRIIHFQAFYSSLTYKIWHESILRLGKHYEFQNLMNCQKSTLKKQKRQTPKMDLPLLKNDITRTSTI